VFLPVDLPLLPSSLVRHLLDRARNTGTPVTIASVAGFGQTFPAVLDRALLLFLQSELDAGRGGCFSAFHAAAAGLGKAVDVVPVEMLAQTGQLAHPEGLAAASWFFNVNSVEDLRRAEELLPGRTRRLRSHRVS
jgi:molybdopterin-guanine dinucleotide biosynthesis protein A